MDFPARKLCAVFIYGSIAVCCGVSNAYTQAIPGPADAGRVSVPTLPVPEREDDAPITIPQWEAPEVEPEADAVQFTLNEIRLDGVTAFAPDRLHPLYREHLEHPVTVQTLQQIVNAITGYYRSQGYFLSRAYLTPQEVQDGVVTIHVIEGYIGEVVVASETLAQHPIIQAYLDRLTQQRPIHSAVLESTLLRMGDLSGYDIQGTLGLHEASEEGAVALRLQALEKDPLIMLEANNYGSRYLGPYQLSGVYRDFAMPFHRVTAIANTSLPVDEVRQGALTYEFMPYPDVTVEVSGSYVRAQPGSTLSATDLRSDAIELESGLRYQLLRQREENLDVGLHLHARNTNGDIFGDTLLTRDRVRSLSASMHYDGMDAWQGWSDMNMTLTQGLDIVGASDPGELTLSRAEAVPDFTKLAFSASRQQPLGHGFSLTTSVAGQYASDPLFSSEEFGYGGSALGRAYDASEITGDHGLAGSVELHYHDLEPIYDLSFTPYVFYDVGRVWNEDRGSKPVSGSSGGLGLNMYHASTSLFANLAVALPMTKPVDHPVYGDDEGARVLFRLGWQY